jgi:transposase-like protein
MNQKFDITKKELQNFLKDGLTINQISEKFGCSDRTLKRYISKFNLSRKNLNLQSKKDEVVLKDKLSRLEQENKKLIKELSLKEDELQNLFNLESNLQSRKILEVKDYKTTKNTRELLSIPTLFCSDEHWGEVVNKSQLNGINEYNSNIARQRLENLTKNYLDIVFNHLNSVNKNYMVLALGGDSVSGDIHDELTNTNDLTTQEAVFDYISHKEKQINELLKAGFKKIFIPCVSGNHDRTTHKIQNKNRVETSNSFIIYNFLNKIYQNNKNVEFEIAKGLDLRYSLNNHNFLLTHGDQFKGGNGIGGITVPILRGFYKKQSMYSQLKQPIDTMMIGHFHQFTSINNGEVIINGSLKGYDEYAQKNNFSFQKSCQAFFLTHPDRGITIQLPIYTD